MNECNYEGAWCTTHQCGIALDAALRPCRKEGCPHCGVKKSRPVNERLLSKRLAAAQRNLEKWEKANAQAAAKVVAYRSEVRRIWKRLEAAGLHVDPMELVSYNPEESDGE